MRVLHITRDFPPPRIGGVSTAVAGLVDHSAAAGVGVDVVSFDQWRPRRNQVNLADPVPVERGGVSVLRLRAPSQVPSAARWGASRPCDIIHVHDALLYEFAEGLAGGRPIVFSAHVTHAEQHRLRALDAPTASLVAERRALARADLVLAPSEAVATLLAPRHAARVVVVPLAPEAPSARAVASRDQDLILSVGRFGDMKGTDTLIALMPRVLEASPTARFVVVGGLPANPKAERRWLRRLHEAGGERLRWAGWCSPAELSRHYRKAALLVAPSRHETFGLVVAEAMRHGLPVVTSAIPALAEIVTHDVSGVLVEPGQAVRFADALLALLDDPAARQRLGAAAERVVRRDLTWSASTEALLGAYRRVSKAID